MFGDKMVAAGVGLTLNGKLVTANTEDIQLVDLVVDSEGFACLDISVAFRLTEDIQHFIRNREYLEFGLVMINEANLIEGGGRGEYDN